MGHLPELFVLPVPEPHLAAAAAVADKGEKFSVRRIARAAILGRMGEKHAAVHGAQVQLVHLVVARGLVHVSQELLVRGKGERSAGLARAPQKGLSGKVSELIAEQRAIQVFYLGVSREEIEASGLIGVIRIVEREVFASGRARQADISDPVLATVGHEQGGEDYRGDLGGHYHSRGGAGALPAPRWRPLPDQAFHALPPCPARIRPMQRHNKLPSRIISPGRF